MHFLKRSAAAIATGVLALAITPAVAIAQTPTTQVSKQMVAPMNEARAAIVAKDWATAKTKLDAAAALTKTPAEKLAVEQLRVSMAANSGDSATMVASVNAIVALNLLQPADLKMYKAALPEAYAKLGDNAKALSATKSYLDEYGGTHDQYYGLSRQMLAANDSAGALAAANKAIEMASASGKAPKDYYTQVMRIHKTANAMDQYYAVEETLVTIHPEDTIWKELIINRAQAAPNFGAPARFDMFRALQAAGVKLSTQEKRIAITEAMKSGLPTEALQILESSAGELTSAEDQDNLKNAKRLVAEEKTSLGKEATDALAKGTGVQLANIGEALLSHGDNAKAAELLQAGISKGIADAGELDLAKLHLGIAQHRSGNTAAAKATWAEVKADNGAAVIARNWILIADKK
jgi:hypothetical protein